MIDLTKALPFTIDVDGDAFLIKTDFRFWIKFGELLKKKDIIDISFLFENEIPTNTQEAFNQLVNFYIDDNYYPKCDAVGTSNPIVDLEHDGDYIVSSFMAKYHIDLTKATMHYHVFRALLNGLTLDYSQIIQIRTYNGNDSIKLREKSKWIVDNSSPLHDEETERLYNLLK